MKIEPSTTVNTRDNGMNIGGYDGPFIDTAHEFRLYFAAVASAPCTQYVAMLSPVYNRLSMDHDWSLV